MQFFTDIAIGILTTYLAFTNTLTQQIIAVSDFVPSSIEVAGIQMTPPEEINTNITQLSSAYEAIPDILLQNTAYQNQGASVISTQGIPADASPTQALVNIYCTYTSSNYTKVTTGTGFFIDRRGVILTNAHVAQFLLLEGVAGDTQCIIRTGTPATPTYEADLLYISPAWIRQNAKLISAARPSGTGERDYALLYVKAGLENKPMPRYFPALSFDTRLMTTNALRNTVFAAGYPAETAFKESDGNAKLIPRLATTSLTELMTFGSNYADVFSIAGSDVGEQGSSGGPIVNVKGDAIGLISTRGDDTQFGKGSLRAITLSYVDRTIKEETGFSLQQNLGGNLPYRSKLFKDTLVPFLQFILEQQLH